MTLYLSADRELTQMGMTVKVERMLHHSGLRDALTAPDGASKRSGDTAMLKEFPGGFLLGLGARSAAKVRQMSARNALLDELDGMPRILGGVGQEEGSPTALVEKRTDAYSERGRKLLYLSTPLEMQTSLIYPLFLAGDQRHYHVPCIHCGFMQPIEWHGVTDAGKHYGITFDLDDTGRLVEESVAYVCRNCSALFHNHDKSWFLPRGEWVPHSTSDEKGLVSFHIPAFLSPPGMYHWLRSVYKWLKAWDVQNDRMRDVDALREFYNLERGLPWEVRGDSPKFERVQQHRRVIYSEGEIPNAKAVEETGAPVVLLTCAVDVHGSRLDAEVVGWCRDRQSYSIEWLHLEGDVDDTESDTGPWGQLAELIEERQWVADDGRIYRVIITLIDVGWAEKAAQVYAFCQRYSQGVFPVMGREMPPRGVAVKEFQESKSKLGNLLYNVTATIYKDRLAAWLKTPWDDQSARQPQGYPNYPVDRPDAFFREYESEEKVQLVDPRTRQARGWRWRQRGQRPNHAWDCRVYGMAGLDMLVLDACLHELELPKLDYDLFFNYAVPHMKPTQYGDERWAANPYSYHPEEIPLT